MADRLGPYEVNSIVCGHVLDVLRRVPDESIHCCITSPPYWGLRDYGTEPQVWGGDEECEHVWGSELLTRQSGGGLALGGNQTGGDKDYQLGERSQGQFCSLCGAWRGSLGLEPDPGMYVQHLVAIFREVRRVLRSDGTLWLNLGASYAAARSGHSHTEHTGIVPASARGEEAYGKQRRGQGGPRDATKIGFKHKDLVPVPWLVALALQADGWWLRSSIIWAKGLSFASHEAECPDCGRKFTTQYSGSCMPESVTDRPTQSYEYVFLLTKAARYYYDQEAVREGSSGQNGLAANFARDTKDHIIPNQSVAQHRLDRKPTEDTGKRNLRSVWAINPSPMDLEYCKGCGTVYTGAGYRQLEKAGRKRVCRECGGMEWGSHFACFSPALIEPMILAGTSERVCPECGAPWERVVERTGHVNQREPAHQPGNTPTKVDSTGWAPTSRGTGKWRPTCICSGLTIIPDQPPKPSRRKGQSELDYIADLTLWQHRMDNWWQLWDELSPLYDAEPMAQAVVLDPFMGSGTTAEKALELGRCYLGIDLNEEYVDMAYGRISAVQPRLL